MTLLGLRRHRRSAAAAAYAEAAMPPGDTRWRRASYAVVDLETTGLNPRRDEIISFASIPVEEGRIVVGEATTAIVRPKRMPEAETIRIHGLRSADLEDAPPLAEVVDVVLQALSGRILVAHAAWVESGFLTPALRSAGVSLRGPALDTAVLAARARAAAGGRLIPEPDPTAKAEAPPGLTRDARGLGLPVHRPHHADGDALTTAQLFIALASRLDRTEPQTVGSLARLSRTD